MNPQKFFVVWKLSTWSYFVKNLEVIPTLFVDIWTNFRFCLTKKMPFFCGVGNTPQKQQKWFTELEDNFVGNFCTKTNIISRKVIQVNRIMTDHKLLIAAYGLCHPSWSYGLIQKDIKDEVIPWCKETGILLLILDNDTKFHSKMLVTECKAHRIEIYAGSGKRVWDRADNGYPPRSHDCMPCETEFANAFEEAQLDLERREKNANKKRTMKMWRNSIRKIWFSRPIEEVQKLIDRQPKIQQEIIKKGGRRTKY